ncbi:hypothetical protein ACFFKE_08505 [Streptomyces mutabilis]|uniref:hypothetical protein n=1 Tax=Streptomyces mutabilis TaxID=67332 RepID=UPI001982C71E|nr:hypothetical protein [Streptomyces mutabilis]GGQ47929.1 hypothetical protein GCM10010279_66970 [Streptomyces mutabilis]
MFGENAQPSLRGVSWKPPRGKVIAELSFGFWRFLLARQYKTNLWPDLAGAFPYAPNRALTTVEDPVKRPSKPAGTTSRPCLAS